MYFNAFLRQGKSQNFFCNFRKCASLRRRSIFERDNDFTGRSVRWYRYFLRFFVPQSVHQPHLTCATPLRPGNSITRGVPPTNSRPGSLGTGCPLLASSDSRFLRRSRSRKKLHARPRLFPSLWDGDGGDATEVVVPPKYYEVDRVAATSGKTPLGVVLARLFRFGRDDRFTFILYRDRMTTFFVKKN